VNALFRRFYKKSGGFMVFNGTETTFSGAESIGKSGFSRKRGHKKAAGAAAPAAFLCMLAFC
jgi:hypothetical protein